ncbi:uncharacterized protein LOC118344870 [Juglans regia]|uniref:Uncharacterized protein LOC118344870 n=1 Tax=Juglans regia TaxID=51240 RepID=A0A6P9E560_JUGRE|nr:uncharacterized protein LOC118344870 [Juglans regia]
MEHWTVDKLIDDQTKGWNLDLLKNILSEEDISNISKIPISRRGIADKQDLLSHLKSEVSEGDFKVFTTTVYLVWKRRNELVFEKKFENPSKLIYNSYQKLRDFKDANASCPSRHSDRPQAAEWTPPQVNGFKANWDAAVDRSRCKIGIGVVVRNWEGKVIATMRSQRTLFPEAKLAEALAALKAVILCKHLQLQNLILEGDALNVVQDINAERRDWSTVGLMILDIKAELRGLKSWSFHHIPRSSNCMAHSLAKDAVKLSEKSITLEEAPPCIQHLL